MRSLGRQVYGAGALALLAVFALLAGCSRPTHDQSVLRAIKAESQSLMATRPAETSATVPETRWPPAIASLEPESVIVSSDGVDIVIKPDFDGGWGYFVPAREQKPPEPAGRFFELGPGIYWYHPY